MLTRRSILAGLGALGLWPDIGRAQSQGAPVRYGWNKGVAGPTRADLYVATTGSDAGPGSLTQPFRTVQRGVDALARRGQGSLSIRGGLYREAVSLDGLNGRAGGRYTIHRHGAEEVQISAAERLEGWQPCSAEEAAAIGADPAGLYVTQIPAGMLAHGSPHALNLHEAGRWASIATDRADPRDPETTGDSTTYHQGQFLIDGSDRIRAIRDQRLVNVPAAWMQQVRALVYHAPNIISLDPLDGFDPQTGTITLDDQSRRIERRGDTVFMQYALQNAGWALQTGTWCVREGRGGILSIYYRPRNPQALNGQIEISVRDTCIDLRRASHVTLFGLELTRAAGSKRLDGVALRRSSLGLSGGEGLRVEHCRIGDCLFAGQRGEGAVMLSRTRGLSLQQCSVGSVRNGFGLALHDSQGADLRNLHITQVSNSPARFFGMRQAILAFSLFEDSALDAHANGFNFYQGSDAVLVYGVRTHNVGGYVTYQKASRIAFCFCEFPSSATGWNRALVSQNYPAGGGQGGPDGSGAPTAGGTFHYLNLTLAPVPGAPEPANALALGPVETTQAHAIHNCVLHGGGFAPTYTHGASAALETRSHNLYTGLSYWQALRYGWQLVASEARIPIGGRITGRTGLDLRPKIIAELAPLFPSFQDWNRDIDGAAIDWSAPPIGCRVQG